MDSTVARPWYREPWPWFLMSLPATAVIAGVTTVVIAIQSADGMVVGDYYKAGLAINQTLQREALAAQLGYRASAGFTDEGRRISVKLEAAPGTTLPEMLQMRIDAALDA